MISAPSLPARCPCFHAAPPLLVRRCLQVTPLLSILRHMAHSRGQQGWREGAPAPRVHLVWVCRHLEEFTCLDGDLLAAARQVPRLLGAPTCHLCVIC